MLRKHMETARATIFFTIQTIWSSPKELCPGTISTTRSVALKKRKIHYKIGSLLFCLLLSTCFFALKKELFLCFLFLDVIGYMNCIYLFIQIGLEMTRSFIILQDDANLTRNYHHVTCMLIHGPKKAYAI